MMTSIAALMTCHNRKDKTINCLQSLFQCRLNENLSLDTFLVDDGSTDGTSSEVKKRFPHVNIIQGSGKLFWNRGMHLAWEQASKNKEYDYYLWLNDDVILFENALEKLFQAKLNNNCIVVGTTCSENKNETTYGGWDISGKLIFPNGLPQTCNEFNGNLVLIPKSVFNLLGNLDPFYHHAIGDFDYSLRAKRKGIINIVAPEYSGYCEAHKTLPKWCLPEVPILTRLKNLYSPLGSSHPYYFFHFDQRHFGWFIAVMHFMTLNLRAFFPSLWKLQKFTQLRMIMSSLKQ